MIQLLFYKTFQGLSPLTIGKKAQLWLRFYAQSLGGTTSYLVVLLVLMDHRLPVLRELRRDRMVLSLPVYPLARLVLQSLVIPELLVHRVLPLIQHLRALPEVPGILDWNISLQTLKKQRVSNLWRMNMSGPINVIYEVQKFRNGNSWRSEQK